MISQPQSPAVAVPIFTSKQDIEQIRNVLAAANYTDEGIVTVLGVDTLMRLGDRRLPPLLHRTSGGTPLHTLIRLFLLEQSVELQAARDAIAPTPLDIWIEAGLLQQTDSGVRATVQLRYFNGLVIAFDFLRRGPGGLPKDYVMGLSPSSLVLAGLTVRRQNELALDLGTGSGIQAILAARHSKHVVGVDCNPRALAISKFNAQLNSITNVEFVQGDMFGPVAGQKFDLIVSNPPFIISPENRHLFMDSGLDNDEICRNLVGRAPEFLNEDGYFVMAANWAVIEGQDWRARLAAWFEGSGCDALVISEGVIDTAKYAAELIEVGESERPQYLRLFNEWLRYYAERKITAIGDGTIIMRKAGGRPNWFATETQPKGLAYPSGHDVALLMDQQTLLHTATDPEGFLSCRFKLASNVRLDQVSEPGDGSWRPVSCTLRRVGGLEFSGSIDPASASLLARFDGTRPLSEEIDNMAGVLQTDANSFRAAAMAIIRRLISQGFLIRV